MFIIKNFGVGRLVFIPSSGAPVEFGTLQNVDIDISWDVPELYGRNQFPEAIGRGKGKITMKAAAAEIRAAALNEVLQGTLTTGSMRKILDPATSATVPTSAPYTLTITPPTSASITQILTVYNVNDLLHAIPMTPVATSGAVVAGSYFYNATLKKFTFAAADKTSSVQYSYEYTVPSSGNTIAVTNQRMGSSPVFAVELYNDEYGSGTGQTVWFFPLCTSNKLTFNTKNTDFTIPDFGFAAFAASNGQVVTVYTDY